MLSCGCPPSGPPSPWRLVVLISGSEGFPSFVSRLDIWLFRQQSGRLAGLHDLLSATVWSGDGDLPSSLRLRTVWHQRLRPCVGHRPLHHAVSGVCGFWLPPLSRLHWPHDTTPCAVVQRASPPRRTLLSSLSVPLYLSWALPPCRICFLFVSSSGASSVFVCFLAQRDGLKASLEASRLGNFSKPKKLKDDKVGGRPECKS